MKCIVHIGTEKTGTTTIQHFLNSNKKTLSHLGYLYPIIDSNHHVNLSVAAYAVDRRDDLTRFRRLYTNEDLTKYQKKVIKKYTKELKKAQSFKATIFSSEHFQSRLTTHSELLQLKTLLNNFGYQDIQILVYLRRPVDLANSLYSTAIKCGATNAYPPSPKNEQWRNICDHQSTLIRFAAVFGEQAIIPRIYSKEEFEHNSLIADFLASINIKQTEDLFTIPKNQNERLSVVGLEILRRVNQRIPVFIDEQPNKLRTGLISYFSNYFKGGSAYMMPEELFYEYQKEFASSNEWVRKKYFPEKDCLFSKAVYPENFQISLNEDELKRIANMIASIWIDKQKQLNVKKPLIPRFSMNLEHGRR